MTNSDDVDIDRRTLQKMNDIIIDDHFRVIQGHMIDLVESCSNAGRQGHAVVLERLREQLLALYIRFQEDITEE